MKSEPLIPGTKLHLSNGKTHVVPGVDLKGDFILEHVDLLKQCQKISMRKEKNK